MNRNAADAELARLVRKLRRARRAFLDVALAVPPEGLETVIDDSGWTVRRLIEYCSARERFHFSRLYNFFDEDVRLFDSPAASLDHKAPQDTEKSLASECSALWLAGRETEMSIDIIDGENLDEQRSSTVGWPHSGWTIRKVFGTITDLYREKITILEKL